MSEKDAQTHPANAKHDSAAVTSPPEGEPTVADLTAELAATKDRLLRSLAEQENIRAQEQTLPGRSRSIRGGGFCRRPAVVGR